MDHKEDRAFVRQFSAVIVAFMVLTVVLIFVARGMQPERDGSDNPSQQALVEKRIAPVGAVRYGDEGAAALAEAQAAAAAAAAGISSSRFTLTERIKYPPEQDFTSEEPALTESDFKDF